MTGGTRNSTTGMEDVYSSADGTTWNAVSVNGSYGQRYDHQMVAFNNRLYIIGGGNNGVAKNDIWSSADGTGWSEVRPSGSIFSARSKHQVVVLNRKLYLVGGYSNGNYKKMSGCLRMAPAGSSWLSREGRCVGFGPACDRLCIETSLL